MGSTDYTITLGTAVMIVKYDRYFCSNKTALAIVRELIWIAAPEKMWG